MKLELKVLVPVSTLWPPVAPNSEFACRPSLGVLELARCLRPCACGTSSSRRGRRAARRCRQGPAASSSCPAVRSMKLGSSAGGGGGGAAFLTGAGAGAGLAAPRPSALPPWPVRPARVAPARRRPAQGPAEPQSALAAVRAAVACLLLGLLLRLSACLALYFERLLDRLVRLLQLGRALLLFLHAHAPWRQPRRPWPPRPRRPWPCRRPWQSSAGRHPAWRWHSGHRPWW